MKKYLFCLITSICILGITNISHSFYDEQIVDTIVNDVNIGWYRNDFQKHGMVVAEKRRNQYMKPEFQKELRDDVWSWVRTLTPYEKQTGNVGDFSKMFMALIGIKYGFKLAFLDD